MFEILTERLVLRQLKPEDWKMISYLRSDNEVNKFVKRSSAETKEKADQFIAKITRGIENKELYYWVITEKEKSEMIGSICLWNFSDNPKSAEVGYDLSPQFQRKGVMDESMKAVLEFGFVKLKLDIIEAYTHSENESSNKLLVRNGFIHLKGEIDENNLDNIIYELKR